MRKRTLTALSPQLTHVGRRHPRHCHAMNTQGGCHLSTTHDSAPPQRPSGPLTSGSSRSSRGCGMAVVMASWQHTFSTKVTAQDATAPHQQYALLGGAREKVHQHADGCRVSPLGTTNPGGAMMCRLPHPQVAVSSQTGGVLCAGLRNQSLRTALNEHGTRAR